jgi:hypothetical protein
MRRSLSFRFFSALFAPWFALSVAEPVALHDCPIHSVHAVASHQMADHIMMADGGMDHAAPPAHRDASSHGSHRQCCCPDSSCASAVVALTSSAPHHAWVPVEIQREVPRAEADSLVPSNAEHVLPFANGPPAARV